MAASESIKPRHAELDELLADPARAVPAARTYIESTALRDDPPRPGPERRTGLELEFHLVDFAAPARRPRWPRVEQLLAGVPELPSGSRLTVEPGGQIELSTRPATGVAAAVAALQADRKVLAAALADAGFGTAPLGADPAREPRRINPASRYAAMERHFAALHCAEAGRAMMTATAALQVNLDAGPATGWAERLAQLRRVGPVLVALSACSPLLAGHRSGWRSMRQEAWHRIDARRGRAVSGSDPAAAWASYALDAPVMLVRNGARCLPVTERVPLTAWLDGSAPIPRRPAALDVEYHLTTLFPPIRLRGYIELRCLDAVPDRWWPALAAMAVTLLDDDHAADRAAELCAPIADRWLTAARDGLADPGVHAAARGCAEVAAQCSPPELRVEVEQYAELIAAGRSPGDDIRRRAELTSPLAVLEEQAHA